MAFNIHQQVFDSLPGERSDQARQFHQRLQQPRRARNKRQKNRKRK